MSKVQPAWPQVYSADPADSDGEVAAPSSATQPFGLSHSAVKLTDICALDPSPASWARAPSCVGEQMFTCAQEEESCSPPCALALAVTPQASATQITMGIRVFRSTKDLLWFSAPSRSSWSLAANEEV